MPRNPPLDRTAYAIRPPRTSSMMLEILPTSSPSEVMTLSPASVAAAITSGPGPWPVPPPTIFAPPPPVAGWALGSSVVMMCSSGKAQTFNPATVMPWASADTDRRATANVAFVRAHGRAPDTKSELMQLFFQIGKFGMNRGDGTFYFRIYIGCTFARLLCTVADFLKVVYALTHAIFVFRLHYFLCTFGLLVQLIHTV